MSSWFGVALALCWRHRGLFQPRVKLVSVRGSEQDPSLLWTLVGTVPPLGAFSIGTEQPVGTGQSLGETAADQPRDSSRWLSSYLYFLESNALARIAQGRCLLFLSFQSLAWRGLLFCLPYGMIQGTNPIQDLTAQEHLSMFPAIAGWIWAGAETALVGRGAALLCLGSCGVLWC